MMVYIKKIIPSALRISIIAICMYLMLSSCATFRVGYERRSYTALGWIKVDPTDKASKNGYKRLQDEMSYSKAVSKHVQKFGMPDYLFVAGLYSLYLGYIEKGIVFEFETTPKGRLLAQHDWRKRGILSEKAHAAFMAAKRGKPALMLILDSSGSMGEKDSYGNLKIGIAKNVVSDVLDKIPAGTTNVSLMAYDNCRTAMLVPLSNTNKELVRSKVIRINPAGKTPIARSIREARQKLANSLQKTTILLISDGLETCGGNPCLEAKRLKQSYNADVKVYSVGYTVDDNTRQQLQCISTVTGGKYFDAKDSFALDSVVYEIVKKEVTKDFDGDGDGVINEKDRCPNTPTNFSVDKNGCETYYTFKIHFDRDSDLIKAEFIQTIKQLADYMKTNNYKVQLQGYTDSTASNTYNKKLSERRAKAVMRKLIQFGIASKRLSFVGFGEERGIADNITSSGRFKNRRVEAHISKF